jgi:predicted AlkP superfamily phosphohydrolase/phosphomutase
MVERVFVIGLDSAPPELLFNEFKNELPNIKKLLERSIYGPMKSCIPAITIPAWMVMATGKTPGELGLYGFRHRYNGSYNEMWIANSKKVTEPTIWDYLGMDGRKSILVGVPPSYPPRKINGWLVSCFITPDSSTEYTYPSELKQNIESLVGDYLFDVVFRKNDRDSLIEELEDMTKKRFEVIRYLMSEKEWDYFHFVEIGLDRVHHAFWKYFDEEHHLYEKDNSYKNVIRDYYKLLDEEIGMTLDFLDEETAIALVSDHGVKRMKGAFAVNQWLIEEDYLKINNPEVLNRGKQIGLADLDINWKKTIAWAWGGYYSRIFLNVEGREPEGVIKPRDYEAVRDEIADVIKSIKSPEGKKWNTEVFYPENIYPVAIGDRPDMMVYFDNLYWRAAGTVGHPFNYLPENDTGPDDAVHSEYGVFSLYIPEMEGEKVLESTIYDFAPTILKLFDIEVPMKGRSLI